MGKSWHAGQTVINYSTQYCTQISVNLMALCTQHSFVILVFLEPLSTPSQSSTTRFQINHQGYPASNPAETVYKQIYKRTSRDDSLSSGAIMWVVSTSPFIDLFINGLVETTHWAVLQSCVFSEVNWTQIYLKSWDLSGKTKSFKAVKAEKYGALCNLLLLNSK